MRELSEKNKFKFALIADKRTKIAKSYNVNTFGRLFHIGNMKTKMAIPSDFLINKKGTIVWSIISTKTIRPSMDTLLEAINKNILNPI